MKPGIVGKVWNIQGNTKSKAVKDNVSDSVSYILNSEKVDASLTMDALNQLNRECKYIENDLKTFGGALVGSHNLPTTDIKEAVNQMMNVKKFYGKTNGRAALHLMISLPSDESDIKNAPKLMQLCESVLKELFPEHQAVFAIHTNTDDMHVHAIINSVGLNGKKIHQPKNFIKKVFQPCINKYAAEYGFRQNEKWQGEENEEKSFIELKINVRNAIDEAIEHSNDFEEFKTYLQNQNIYVNVGKYISIKLPGMKKAIRTQHLGSNYTLDSIVERITTRKDEFDYIQVGHYSISRPEDEVVPNWHKLKRFKELSKEEKDYYIKQLKLGKDPWRENRLKNWQQNRIANHINSKHRIDEYVKHYSSDGTINGALEGIIEIKKKVAYEKKLVSYAKVKYKPILDIYKEMQPIMKKAYLYEYNDAKEYFREHEKYRQLTKRLREGYGKDVFEVAFFLNECEEMLLYAKSELKELSAEYRELKSYGQRHQLLNDDKSSLLDLTGIYDTYDIETPDELSIDISYIASIDSDVIARLERKVGKNKYGDSVEEYKITLLNKDGRVIRTIENSGKLTSFENELEKVQQSFHLEKCKKFSNVGLAQEFINKSKLFRTYKNNSANLAQNEKTASSNTVGTNQKNNEFTFAQAINHVHNKTQTNVVIDTLDPNYIAVSTVKDEVLKIVILDTDNKPIDSAEIPIVEEKNTDGYKKIIELKDKYGFSDKVSEHESIEDASRQRAGYKTAGSRVSI